MSRSDVLGNPRNFIRVKLNKLLPGHVQKIDEFLVSVGDYGEVRLVVQNGELRYINKLKSHKAQAVSKKKGDKEGSDS